MAWEDNMSSSDMEGKMITPNETMFIILGVLLVNGLITCYVCYLLDKRLIEIEKKINTC